MTRGKGIKTHWTTNSPYPVFTQGFSSSWLMQMLPRSIHYFLNQISFLRQRLWSKDTEYLALPLKKKKSQSTPMCAWKPQRERQDKEQIGLPTAWLWVPCQEQSQLLLPGITSAVTHRACYTVPLTHIPSVCKQPRRPIFPRTVHLSFNPLLSFNNYWAPTTEKTDVLGVTIYVMYSQVLNRKKKSICKCFLLEETCHKAKRCLFLFLGSLLLTYRSDKRDFFYLPPGMIIKSKHNLPYW